MRQNIEKWRIGVAASTVKILENTVKTRVFSMIFIYYV